MGSVVLKKGKKEYGHCNQGNLNPDPINPTFLPFLCVCATMALSDPDQVTVNSEEKEADHR